MVFPRVLQHTLTFVSRSALPRTMSSIADFSDTASPIEGAGQFDDPDLNANTPSPASSPASILSVSRQRTSPIWRYCRIEDVKEVPAAWIDSNGTKWWHCQPCFDKKRGKKYNYSGGSSTIVHHLRKEHNIVICGRESLWRSTQLNQLQPSIE